MKTICTDCKGENIEQQGTIMLPVNETPTPKELEELWMEDYYWCEDCEMECTIEEVEE